MPIRTPTGYDIAHLLDTGVLILSFAFLYQRRLFAILKIYSLQALFLAGAAAWQAHAQDAPHLYITAGIALVFKAIAIPVALHRIIVRLKIHRAIETVISVGPTLIVGVALVGLSIWLVLPVTTSSGALTRESLTIALSVVLLGLLMMITRRNAVSQVVGFMSMENGLILAAVGVKGMPLVVELSAAFSVMVAFIIFGVFFFHIRERFDTLDVHDMEKFRGEQRLNPVLFIIGIPAITGIFLAFVPYNRFAAQANVLASGLTFAASLTLFADRPATTAFILVDDFNIYLIALTAFVAFTTSLFSARYIIHEVEIGRLQSGNLRFYHAMYQGFIFTMLMVLTTNNLGVMWVSLEGATLTTVLMVGLYRTAEALEAAWKYFILCGVGIALALFGTTLMYLAAQPVMGEGLPAMTWAEMLPRVGEFSPAILNLAFVFLLVGYGTKVGLAPLHAWLPDAHAEGPTPISAVLSGLLLNVALYIVLRFKILLTANAAALAPGPLMVTMGLSSLLLASFMLYRRRDIKRMFAYSSIEHMGIITFAFGMGGPLANFAGLLHMTMHSLTKSAIFFAVGHISQVKGTQKIADIRGLTSSQPVLGWALVIGVVAIAGLPPFGVFMSEFLVLTSTFGREPVLALLVLFGLLVGFGALIRHLQHLAFGPGGGGEKASSLALLPLFVHLGLVLTAGIYLPGPLVTWFQNVARLLG